MRKYAPAVTLFTLGLAALGLQSANARAADNARSSLIRLADAPAQQTAFSIKAQPLEDALNEFAKQTGYQVLFQSGIIEKQTAPPLNATLTPDQALQTLLTNTELHYKFVNPRTVTISTAEQAVTTATGRRQTSLRIAQNTGNTGNTGEGNKGTEGARNKDSQQSSAPVGTEPSEAPAGAKDSLQEIREVVVTGSRIKREGSDAPVPTMVLDADAIAATGAIKVQSILDELPSIAPGIQDNNSGNFSFALAGLNMANLRDLDVRRTLVLVNGRRFTPTLTDADSNITAVDLSSIPTPMIARIEVITGGTGAVYGSDAVAGVINIILKDNFQGFQTDVQYGQSGKSDGASRSISATGGLNWENGRGNSIVHFGYSSNERVKLEDRDFIVNRLDALANPAGTAPGDGIPDFVVAEGLNLSAFSANVVNFRANISATPDANGNYTTAGSLTRFAIDPVSGAVRPFNGTPRNAAATRFEGGTDGAPVSDADLIVPVDRYLFGANTRYEIASGLNAFLNINYALTRATNFITPSFECEGCFRSRLDGVTTSRLAIDHPFVLATPGLPELMTAAGMTEIEADRSNREFGARGTDIDRDLWQVVGGLKGAFGQSDWEWEASYQLGESRNTSTVRNDLIESKFYEAVINVEAAPGGGLQCASALARVEGCVPFNILSNTLQPAAAAYVSDDHTSHARFRQDVVNAFATGRLMDLPAGALRMAAGVEYRREEVDIDQSSVYNNGSGFFGTQLPDLAGKLDVREGFAEVRIPLLRDMPGVRSLDVELAARQANYSTAGSANSWNAKLDWGITQDVRFRGTLARAVRAPKVGELFTPATNSASGVTDPCDSTVINSTPTRAANCAALGVPVGFVAPPVTTGVTLSGNTGLDVELGDTYTLGVVLTPRWVENLTMTLDYWNIQIEDAITLFPFDDVLANCVDAPNINNAFCAQQTRLPNGAVDRVSSTFINASVFETSGFDWEGRYTWNLGDRGALRFRATATYLEKRNFILNPSAASDASIADPKAGEHGTPRLRGSFGTMYGIGKLKLSADVRYVGHSVGNVRASAESSQSIEASERFYTDLQGRYNFGDRLEVYAGIDNVMDQEPPRNPFVFSGTGRLDTPSQIGAALYDVYGRFFYMGASMKF